MQFIVQIKNNHYPFPPQHPHAAVYPRKTLYYTDKTEYQYLQACLNVLETLDNPILIRILRTQEQKGCIHLLYQHITDKLLDRAHIDFGRLRQVFLQLAEHLATKFVQVRLDWHNFGLDQAGRLRYYLPVEDFYMSRKLHQQSLFSEYVSQIESFILTHSTPNSPANFMRQDSGISVRETGKKNNESKNTGRNNYGFYSPTHNNSSAQNISATNHVSFEQSKRPEQRPLLRDTLKDGRKEEMMGKFTDLSFRFQIVSPPQQPVRDKNHNINMSSGSNISNQTRPTVPYKATGPISSRQIQKSPPANFQNKYVPHISLSPEYPAEVRLQNRKPMNVMPRASHESYKSPNLIPQAASIPRPSINRQKQQSHVTSTTPLKAKNSNKQAVVISEPKTKQDFVELQKYQFQKITSKKDSVYAKEFRDLLADSDDPDSPKKNPMITARFEQAYRKIQQQNHFEKRPSKQITSPSKPNISGGHIYNNKQAAIQREVSAVSPDAANTRLNLSAKQGGQRYVISPQRGPLDKDDLRMRTLTSISKCEVIFNAYSSSNNGMMHVSKQPSGTLKKPAIEQPQVLDVFADYMPKGRSSVTR